MKKILSIISFALAGLICVAFAAEPPELINYQGVLRDSEGAPVEDGIYDMVFRFFDLESGGSLLLTDDHSGGDAVETSDGLFNVQLGSGTITPGTYDNLSDLFANESEVYLEVQVGTDAPMVPRMRIVTAAYALNADQLDGMNSDEFAKSSHTHAGTDITSPVAEATNADMVDSIHADATATPNYLYPLDANGKFPNSVLYSGSGSGLDADLLDGNDSTFFLDTSDYGQTKNGSLWLFPPSGNSFALHARVSHESGSAIVAENSMTSSWAHLAEENRGIEATGTEMGARFEDADNSGYAYLGYGDTGIRAYGSEAGATFVTDDPGTFSSLAVTSGGWGIHARGATAGGLFEEASPHATYAYIANVDQGISAYGDGAGGYFEDTNGTGHAYVGYGNRGIEGYGTSAGGYFEDTDGTSEAWAGHGNFGIEAYGNEGGGYFEDKNQSAKCWAATSDHGVHATGNVAGGYFKDDNSSGYAYVGYGDIGIEARGSGDAGFFKNTDETAWVHLATSHFGVRAWGTERGGYFQCLDKSGGANLGIGDVGVQGYGNDRGGDFWDANDSGSARIGYGDLGIHASGSAAGGHFEDTDQSGVADIAIGDTGVEGYGSFAGGYFAASAGSGSGQAWIGQEDYGVYATGDNSGGVFQDLGEGSYACVGCGPYGVYATGGGWPSAAGYFEDVTEGAEAWIARGGYGVYGVGDQAGGYFRDQGETGSYAYIGRYQDGTNYKVKGSGSVNFVQNHPEDHERVVVYAAPEGDEVAVYTRGSARLVAGEARVPLGETFRWVANPDLGLTAHVTPRGEWADLYVESVSTSELVVRSRDGATAGAFDYIVYGLRIGFEQMPIVQVKEDFSPAPPAGGTAAFYSEHPELRRFAALERYKTMHAALGETEAVDLSRAEALLAAVNRFDPDVDGALRDAAGHRPTSPGDEGGLVGHSDPGGPSTPPRDELPESGLSFGHAGLSGGASLPIDEEGNVYGKSFRPSSTDVARYMPAADELSAGDVVVIDRERPGFIVAAAAAADPGVIGIVAGEPGVLLGGSRPAEFEPAAGEEPGDGGEDAAATVDAVAMAPTQVPIALSGIVLCKVDASYGPILPGDLLTTSPTRGHAMRAGDPLPGTVLGKALERVDKGAGLISVLVMLR